MERPRLHLQRKISTIVMAAGLLTAGSGTAYGVYENHTTPASSPVTQELQDAINLRNTSSPDSEQYRKADAIIGKAILSLEEKSTKRAEQTRQIQNSSIVAGGILLLAGFQLRRKS